MEKEKEAVKQQTIKAYKAFDKNLKCKDMQYEVGKEYSHKGKIKICESGLHSVEYPLDVLRYYVAAESRFAEVEASGDIQKHNEDTKLCSSVLKVKAEINLKTLIKAAIDFTFSRINKTKEKVNDEERGLADNKIIRGAASNSGDSGAASNSGDRGAASNSGDSGAASNSGDSGAAFSIGSYSASETNAKESVAVAVGYQNKAKGNIGSWIVIAERNRNDTNEILDIQSFKVDGKTVKENTWYKLEKSKLIED